MGYTLRLQKFSITTFRRACAPLKYESYLTIHDQARWQMPFRLFWKSLVGVLENQLRGVWIHWLNHRQSKGVSSRMKHALMNMGWKTRSVPFKRSKNEDRFEVGASGIFCWSWHTSVVWWPLRRSSWRQAIPYVLMELSSAWETSPVSGHLFTTTLLKRDCLDLLGSKVQPLTGV